MFTPNRHVSFLVTFACLILPSLVALAADKPAAPAKDKDFDAPKSWVLDLELIDKASGEPFANCPLSVQAERRQFAFVTDDRGHAAVEYPDGVKYLSISLKPDGYVPTTLTWRTDTTKDPIPDSFKFELERGTTIGGLVQDESGNPIAGAKVHLLVRRKGEDGNGRVNTNLFDYPVTTDGQGRWRCDLVPKEMEDPWIRLTHPDYLSDEVFGTTPKPPMDKLRDMTGVMVMKKGVPLAGRVTDAAGKGIAGAAVLQGRDRFGSNYPQIKTDRDGNFRFAQVRPGADIVLTVTAKGFSPDQKTVIADQKAADVAFKLEPAHVIRGRVVDPAGKPLAGVMIATDTWRGNRALMFRTDTDADGRFVWADAPADEVLTDVLKQGYMDNRHVPLKPSNEEITITLRPPVHVTGVVTDAETGKPVENFKVIQGIDWGNDAQQGIYWWRSGGGGGGALTHDDGKFELDITDPHPGHAVRVEAEGYLPAESRVFKDTEPTVSLELKLKKGHGLAGTLRTPDGKPLAGADVVLATPQNGLYVRNGQLEQRREVVSARSDESGHYSLPPQTGTYVLVVLHDNGYAKVTAEQLAQSGDITVQPWGRVTGILRVGANPKAGETIVVSPREFDTAADRNTPRVYHDIKATTDKDGRFTAARVPPGPAGVSLEVRLSQYSSTYTQTQQADVRAGETAEVNIGGVGRPVVGKIVAPAYLAEKIQWTKAQAGFSSQIKAPQPKFPDDWNKLTPADRQKFYAHWQKSPEGQAAIKLNATQKHFSFKINPDGSFRADDVPAGTYRTMIVVYGGSNQAQYSGPAVATAQSTFTVPEMPTGRSDDALDVGTIDLKPANPIPAK